jgi:hypothetical protein
MLRCNVGMLLPAIAQAAPIEIKAEADTALSYRADLLDDSGGTHDRISVGGEGSWGGPENTDLADLMVRINLSSLAGMAATGAGTLTVPQASGYSPRNFSGESLDAYAMRLDNADWEEGVSGGSGAAVIRKKGSSSNPPDADKWLPIATNRPTTDMVLVGSTTWTTGDAAISVPQATLNSWIADGVVSLIVRSDSVRYAKEFLGDTVQRDYRVGVHDFGDLAHTVSLSGDFVAVPEPTSVVLLATAALGLLAYAWRNRK